MSKKYFAFLFVFFITSFSLTAKEKNITYFIKKYNLPENLNILSVFGEDCVNCYYGFSHFLKEHAADFKKEYFIFLFQNSAENEIDNIFKFRLGFEKAGYKIIVDDEFYACVNKNGVTTLSIIEKAKAIKRFTSKDIYKFKSFARSDTFSSVKEFIKLDTIDLMGRFGTKKLAVTLLNESKIVVQNKYTNDVFLYDINTMRIIKKLPISTFTESYDSLLTLLLTNNPENLDYNLKHYKEKEFYKSFPLCSIQEVYCFDNHVYLCLSVAQMEVDTNNHIIHRSQLAMVKLDSNLQIRNVYKIPERIPNSDKLLNFFDCILIAQETAVVSLSVSDPSGLRKKDSICALYSMATNEIKILNLSYESFMPLKGNNGYSNYYHFDIWNENDVLKGYFNRSPFVYDLSNNTKSLIPDIGIEIKTIEINGKDKFFWISKIFQYQNSTFVIANQKEKETSILQYDKDIKTFVSKKKIFEGCFSDIYVIQNKIFAFEGYSEKGDVATLHIYKIE